MVPAPDVDVTKELAVARESVLVLEWCRRSRLALRSKSIVRLLAVDSTLSPSLDLLPVDLGLTPRACDELAFLSCDVLPTGDETGSGLFLGVTGDSGIFARLAMTDWAALLFFDTLEIVMIHTQLPLSCEDVARKIEAVLMLSLFTCLLISEIIT